MATILDLGIDRQRRHDISENAAAMGERTLREYVVQIKSGAAVRRTFTAMGPDSCTVAVQHECLCRVGEYVKVDPREITEDDWLAADLDRATNKAAKAHARNDAAAVEAQLVDFRARGLL